jgi:hypothetical protein
MRESEANHVVHQLIRHFPVGKGPIPLLRHPLPRTSVNFVDRHRTPVGVCFSPFFHPRRVIPLIPMQVVNDGSCLQTVL